MKKKIMAAVLCTSMIVPTVCVNAEIKESDIKSAIEDAIEWKADKDSPFYGIGSYSADLYIMALNRMGKNYDYSRYLAGLDGVAAGYGEEHNASSMQRTVLATIAAGGDPRNVGGRDLVADGIYYRNDVSPLGKEGVDGYSWGLIALDSKSFETPEWALSDRNNIIAGILSHQNTNGSFDDSVYSTAVAVTALAPYYETSGAYTITQNQTGYVIDLSPKDAVEEALNYLSEEQSKDGDWGNLESTAMTVIALDTLGVNADSDDRFVAKNGSAIDGLMQYQQKDGGFSTGKGKSNSEATSLAVCALTSHLRKLQGKSTFFNFEVNDSIVFETPAPTKTQSSSGTSSSSSNKTSSSTTKSKATTKPKSTTKTTARPKATAKVSGTMKPTKTASPMESSSPKPSSTPRPTKKPALVGPVEMPGPMPSFVPDEVLPQKAGHHERKSGGTAVAIVSIVALLCLAGIVVVLYLGRTKNVVGKGIFKYLMPKKKKKNEIHKAKQHRKTEQHRCYEEREKFKKRRKFDKRRR